MLSEAGVVCSSICLIFLHFESRAFIPCEWELDFVLIEWMPFSQARQT